MNRPRPIHLLKQMGESINKRAKITRRDYTRFHHSGDGHKLHDLIKRGECKYIGTCLNIIHEYDKLDSTTHLYSVFTNGFPINYYIGLNTTNIEMQPNMLSGPCYIYVLCDNFI